MVSLTVDKPPVLPIFRRLFVLIVAFSISIFVACSWFSFGLNWIYDSNQGYSPLLSCPSFILNSNGQYPNGPLCSMQLQYSFPLAQTILSAGLSATTGSMSHPQLGKCYLPSSPDGMINCYWSASCDNVCEQSPNGGRCPDPSTLQNPANAWSQAVLPQCTILLGTQLVTLDCFFVTVNSYCDTAFDVTPSNEIAIRGIIFASAVIVLIWIIAEFILRCVDISLRKEVAIGRVRQSRILPDKKARMRALLEQRWREEMEKPDDDFDGSGIFSPSASVRGPLSTVGGPMVGGGATPRALGASPMPSPMARTTMARVGLNAQYGVPGLGHPGTSIAAMSEPGTPRTAGMGTPRARQQLPAAFLAKDPRRRFESNAWKRRVRQWRSLRSRKVTTFHTREFVRSMALNAFFLCILIVTLFVIIKVSPQHINESGNILNVLKGDVSIWVVHSPLDVIIFIDVLLDTGLFILACCAVTWPRAPLFSQHLQGQLKRVVSREKKKNVDTSRNEDDIASQLSSIKPSMPHPRSAGGIDTNKSLDSMEKGSSQLDLGSSIEMLTEDGEIMTESEDTKSLSFVLKQSLSLDCCLMVACHQSTITKEKSEIFSSTLRSALMIFPPAHIFICDNGNSPHPVDDTQMVTHEVHPDINYLYIPEGNKTFAFYWCTRYWIPFLTKCGRVPDFTYSLIIDDDVPLPADLHIPHEHLRQHEEIKAVHFPLTATTPDGKPGLLVKCQDIEYKLAAVHKQFQSLMSRCLSCHGAIALWERKAMEEVFYAHDTVFHGEDMYMGLCLLRRRDKSKIISCSQTVVPTYAPDTWSVLFRQRVKSWELTSHRKTLTYVKELLNPKSFCHAASICLKPYFLQEVITILLDWLRMYLLVGLILRDWWGLILMTAVFTTLMYLQVIGFWLVVLRQRKDLRPSLFAVAFFPFYKFGALLFRLCALCQNLLVYSFDKSGTKIGIREDEIRDIPPCPPHPDVDWYTVFLEPEQPVTAAATNDLAKSTPKSKHRHSKSSVNQTGKRNQSPRTPQTDRSVSRRVVREA